MRIGQHKSGDKPRGKPARLKPPPDYSSRRVQWKLLGMVALLMLVITVAFEARDPARWQWLTNLDRLAEQASPEIDSRLRVPVEEPAPSDEVVLGKGPRLPINELKDTPATALTPVDRAWASGWQDVYQGLAVYDRTILYDLLKLAREQQQADEATQSAATDTLERLERAWGDYLAVANAGVLELSAEEKAAWQSVLEELEQRWLEIKPLLATLGEGDEISESQRTQLAGLQDLLDRLQFKVIQDNTPWRASEREIWFRLLGKLQNQADQDLQQQSPGVIGYAQLFKQPDAYRGKLVTVRGTAEAVYEVPAPKNSYGIERYWVYWLRPSGGPNSPILIYALEKPDGFPSIAYEQLGKAKMASQEEVEFTGFFLKRYAYHGQGGIYTAPLVLAQEPKWLKPALGPSSELPSLLTSGLVVAAMALLATALAAWVYHQYRPGQSARMELPARISIKP